MEEEKKEKRRPGVLPAVLGVLLLGAEDGSIMKIIFCRGPGWMGSMCPA